MFYRAIAFVALPCALLVLSSACKTSVSPPVPQPPPASAEPAGAAAPEAAVDEAALAELLEAADRAIAEDRLMTPANDNAFDYYAQAAELSPAHPAVRTGLERIVERYLILAQQAIGRQRWAGARSMLDRATLVDANHPGIEAMRRQVRLLAGARRLTLALDQQAVRGRLPASAAKLATFGKQAREANARVTIRAANDADGRWMYQQLSKSPGTRRIRASMEVGLPPNVTIVLLPADDATAQQVHGDGS